MLAEVLGGESRVWTTRRASCSRAEPADGDWARRGRRGRSRSGRSVRDRATGCVAAAARRHRARRDPRPARRRPAARPRRAAHPRARRDRHRAGAALRPLRRGGRGPARRRSCSVDLLDGATADLGGCASAPGASTSSSTPPLVVAAAALDGARPARRGRAARPAGRRRSAASPASTTAARSLLVAGDDPLGRRGRCRPRSARRGDGHGRRGRGRVGRPAVRRTPRRGAASTRCSPGPAPARSATPPGSALARLLLGENGPEHARRLRRRDALGPVRGVRRGARHRRCSRPSRRGSPPAGRLKETAGRCTSTPTPSPSGWTGSASCSAPTGATRPGRWTCSSRCGCPPAPRARPSGDAHMSRAKLWLVAHMVRRATGSHLACWTCPDTCPSGPLCTDAARSSPAAPAASAPPSPPGWPSSAPSVTVLDRDGDGAAKVAAEVARRRTRGRPDRRRRDRRAGPRRRHPRQQRRHPARRADRGLRPRPVRPDPPVMLQAPFRLARALLPGMYERGWGRIVHVSSVHGHRASPYKSAYVSAKHGLEGLSKVIALEGAEKGVTSNTVCPGYVRTPLVEGQIADQARTHGIAEDEVSTTSCSPAPPSSGWSSRTRWPTGRLPLRPGAALDHRLLPPPRRRLDRRLTRTAPPIPRTAPPERNHHDHATRRPARPAGHRARRPTSSRSSSPA